MIGCLRLATKYAFGELRERIINNMLVDCPSTHDEWMTVRNSDRRDYWGPPRFFQLACLVCEQELPRVLLPTLIYDLCTFDVPSILDAFRASSQTMPMAIRETVLQIALVGREGFRTEKHEMIETLEERLPKCVRGDPACQKKHVLWFYSMHESIRYGDTDHELFFADISDTSTSPCRACNVRAEEILEELRDDSWQILPRSLNLLPPDEQRAKPPSAQHLDDDEFNALTGWDQLKYYQGVRVVSPSPASSTSDDVYDCLVSEHFGQVFHVARRDVYWFGERSYRKCYTPSLELCRG